MDKKIATIEKKDGHNFYQLPFEVFSKIGLSVKIHNIKTKKWIKQQPKVGILVESKRKTDDTIKIYFN